MMDARDPMDRLSSAYTIEVGPETAERHIAEIDSAIRTAPPTPIPTGLGIRRRIAAAAAAIVVLAPAGMALAAEDAVPGDFLYPVKEITERVRSYIDQDVEATHRVEEVERLLFRRAPGHAVARAVERAESATVHLPESGELRLRLELVREHLQQQDEERQIAEREGSTGGQTGTDSGSDQTRQGDESGTSTPPGTQGPGGQDRQGSSGTSTTSGQHQAEPGEGRGSDSSN